MFRTIKNYLSLFIWILRIVTFMKLISGTANLSLATEISQKLNIPLTERLIQRFKDEEIFVRIDENVRGEDIFIIQSTSAPANDHLMELLICLDALTRASASRITAIIPYFGYARQDRKTGGRTPISAKLTANLIAVAGANRVLTLDLHAGQIQGFFDIPTDNLYTAPVIEQDLYLSYDTKDLMIVSPDVGGLIRARALAKCFDADIAIVDKRRPGPGQSEVMNIIGDVKDRKCLIVDDIVDSGGTLVNAAQSLIEHGAKSVSAYATHGVLSGSACEQIENSKLSELIITNTIEQSPHVNHSKKIRELSVASLIGEAIRRIANNESVSKLFD